MTTPILKVENLGHVYPGNVVAVKDVSLEIQPAEIVGVIGQNGSGKTTLVKHFNNLLKPTSGKVFFDGKDTSPLTIQKMAGNVGYVFQNPNQQLFARTVEDELEFGPRNLGLSEEEVEERKEKAIEFFRLQDLRHKHPYRIGFPLRKLVGMASIYTMQPAVFIMDEPTTGQDNITTQTVYRLIHRLRDQGATVICVAHDMILLAEVVDRLIVMRDAQLIADASPREVFADEAMMTSTHLMPPQITQLSMHLQNKKESAQLMLSVDEFVQAVKKNKS
ncbi:MAG: ABC transporter ATP-binding protein [Anaerolineaceae bacterium]|nr:ABC transporter ATP-binding protein [Anaerolineaceae bacterium]